MANQVYINITRSSVLEEVYKTTAYIGAKAGTPQDTDAYNRIAATSVNDEQLVRYFSEAGAEAKQALGHWLDTSLPANGYGQNDYISFQFSMPDNWIPALQGAVEEQLRSHLVNAVLWRWLMLTKKDEAAAYQALSNESMLRVKQLLLMRKRPTRRAAPSGGGDDEPTADGIWHDNDLWLDANNWQENN